ncbi:MAG: hypothetical protein DHS80DRAFT_23162 [Piptocephalis tieghemiana]|nr:MAG: hypothetical protein DHS80DRAFT_23162 [Piptocephalis tieghemiana]
MDRPMPPVMPSPSWERARVIIQKRVSTFQYLKRVHSGSSHYLNTFLLTPEDLSFVYDNTRLRRRAQQYYIFGLSLAALLDILNLDDYLRSLTSLVSEYETWTADTGGSSKMRNLFRKSKGEDSDGPGSGGSKESSGTFDPTKGDHGDFTFLETRTTIPFDLDFLQTFCTLCDISAEVYAKILNNAPSTSPHLSTNILETLSKIDHRFKKFIVYANKELDAFVRQGVKEELRLIDPLLSKPTMSSSGASEEWQSTGQSSSMLSSGILGESWER